MFKRVQGSGRTAQKDVIMALEITPTKLTSTVKTAHSLDPNTRLAWGGDRDVFALRLPDQPPEPSKRLFEL